MMQKRNKRRGFTLTEAAIVIGIAGLIMGAIWAAAGSIYAKHRLEQGTNQVWQIAIKVRDIYKGHPYPAANLDKDETATMITQQVITNDLVDPATGVVVNPWGGTYEVWFHRINQFYIIVNLPATIKPADQIAACSDLLSRIQAVGAQSPLSAAGPKPIPSPLPAAADTTQGGAPTNAFLKAGANWTDMSGEDAEGVAGLLAGGVCSGVAFYFTI